MFEKNSKLLFLIALTIGGIGAFGEAYLIHHELVDYLPYKIIDANFHQTTAITGLYFAPIIAVVIGLLFGLKRFWSATILPVVSCPLLFALILKIFSFMRDGENHCCFDGKSSEVIGQEFILYTISMAMTGLVIALICNFLLSLLSKQNKLA